MSTFEEQIAEIEAANAGGDTEMTPGAGDPPKDDKAGDTPTDNEKGDDDVDSNKHGGSDRTGDSDNDADKRADDEAGDEGGDDGEDGDDSTDDNGGGDRDDDDINDRRRSKPAHKRIAELTAAKHADARKIAELEAQIAAGQQAPQEAAEELVVPERPNPDTFDYGESDPKYIEALYDYKLDLRDHDRKKAEAEARKEQGQQQQQQQMVQAIQSKAAEAETAGREKYEDFDAKVNAASAARGGQPLPPIVSVGVAVSPVGADLIYRLATDADVTAKLEGLAKQPAALAMALGELEGEYVEDTTDADLDPSDSMDQMRMVGRMRARMSGKTPKAPTEVRPTGAPTPPKKRAKGGAGKTKVSPDTDNIQDFMRDFGGDIGL